MNCPICLQEVTDLPSHVKDCDPKQESGESSSTPTPSENTPSPSRVNKYAEWKRASKSRLLEELDMAEMRCELLRFDLRERDIVRILADPHATEQDFIARQKFDPEAYKREIEARVQAEQEERERLKAEIRAEILEGVKGEEEGGDFVEELLAQLGPEILEAFRTRAASSPSPTPPPTPPLPTRQEATPL